MGSEQYCLRWNNHQSNLLGVFSQLLQDESLVDVTLVCSEGTSIRAHKVVLSACSSYFQSLFLDHPARHPIVILKDVRFIELRTLIEFMYKGEVNVQYCQLSELLKTAESLKVKGLVEMTNQNTALREHEPPTEPERLRSSHLLSSKSDNLDSSSSAITAAASSLKGAELGAEAATTTLNSSSNPSNQNATSNTNNNKSSSSSNITNNSSNTSTNPSSSSSSSVPTNSSSSTLSRLSVAEQQFLHYSQQQQQQQLIHHSSAGGMERCSSASPISIHHPSLQHGLMSPTTPLAFYANSRLLKPPERARERDMSLHQSQSSSSAQHQQLLSKHRSGGEDLKRKATSIDDRPMSPSDDYMGDEDDEDNLPSPDSKTKLKLSNSGIMLDDRPGSSHNEGESRLTPQPSSSSKSEIGRSISSILGSHHSHSEGADSMPGPSTSGMLPMQQVPLSLKKEIDWDRNDDKEGLSDFRHPGHDPDATEVKLSGLGLASSPPPSHGSPPSSSSSGLLEGAAAASIYSCMYCSASFPHQSKLTRHILSHSLETLKFRDMLHPAHLSLLPPPPSRSSASQQFNAALVAAAAAAVTSTRSSSAGQPSSIMDSPMDGKGLGVDLGGSSSMEMDFSPTSLSAMGAMGPGSSSNQLMERGGGNGSAPGCGNSSANNEIGGSVGNSGSPSGTGGSSTVVLCKFCGKSFPDVSTLITHLPVHTGDRPFKCEFCGKAFKLRHHMKDHCRVHTGERPFRCSMCGKTFSRSTILKAHEKTHYPKYVRKFLSPSPDDTTQ